MTREEAIKILSILKAAYPNSYRGMTKDEALGTVNVWASQFADVPYFVVSLAVSKLIGTNTFPPAIKEVKDKLRSLYFEASTMLIHHNQATVGVRITGELDEVPLKIGKPLDDKTLAAVKEIVKVCEHIGNSNSHEATLGSLISGMHESLLPSASENLLCD